MRSLTEQWSCVVDRRSVACGDYRTEKGPGTERLDAGMGYSLEALFTSRPAFAASLPRHRTMHG